MASSRSYPLKKIAGLQMGDGLDEVTCPCCSKPIRVWQPYRVQDRLFICFRHCDVAQQIEARFEVAKRD